ncbi:regulator of nonsense transcripts 3A isoform X1 [Frieseomelitta varia]|uniref:regulator of nonsense transcripts 3A isoform X1 n=2 Tax=Frieseomelitta varia TaxID=561572 RepID=UPI001CB68EF4|nr:regulator of nonsense transcripts 3A isoform X1 [Frieseomelitta varia]
MTMTEETQQSETAAQNEAQTSSPDVGKVKDNKKEKCRPMTKVVIRRLPPTMTQEQFLEQVSPLPEHDYLYFVKADMSMGQYAFSRAYINFVEQHDIFMFREKFDNYVFVDSKGTEYPAVVEFAPFQRLPKKKIGKKKDLKCGTIESDPYYVSFLESLKNQEAESNVSQPKTEYSYQPPDNTPKKVTTTPLLEYVKQRKQEKQRLRDEKREERRRRDLERRRSKEDPIISKVLKNPDLDKEMCRDNKENREEKDKLSPKDIKNRIKKEDKLRDKIPRDRDSKSITKGYRERIEDRNKDRDIKHQRRHEDKKIYGRRDERDGINDRRFDGKDDRKYDFKEDIKDSRERKIEEKRGKSYEKMRQEKKRLAETKKQNIEFSVDMENGAKLRNEDEEFLKKESEVDFYVNIKENEETMGDKDVKINKGKEKQETNERKILIDSLQDFVTGELRRTETAIENSKDIEKSRSIEDINKKTNEDDESEEKKDSKVTKRRSSLESGGEGGTGDGNCLRRHKSLDGGDQNNLQKTENEDKEKDKKDPRLERRIRNKDRPTMEIYRPGMGKFSKQRLEREKSNTNDERASLSQSPTPNPNSNNLCKSGKPGTEVRSMTFKRSISRDLV